VQAHEPELARVAGRPGHDDALRLEQRLEALGARAPACGGRGRTGSVDRYVDDLDERVDGHGSAVDHDERVHVDRHHVGPRLGDGRQPQQHRLEGRPVDRGLAAEGPEERLGGEAVEHVVGVGVAQGHQPQHHVGHGLGEDPTHAEHDGGPELRVEGQARDQLTGAGHHGRHQHPDLAVGRRGRGEQGVGRLLDRARVAQVEPHEAPLGLVGDAVAAQLRDHGVAELGGRRGGVGSRGHDPLAQHRDAVAGQQRLRGRLGLGVGGRGGGRRVGHGRRAYSGPSQPPVRAPCLL